MLYSAAGNFADEHWYSRGIFAWNFEVGANLWDPADRGWTPSPSSAAPIPVGAGSTRVHWFSVDAAGNVENRYDPFRPGSNFRKETVTVG